MPEKREQENNGEIDFVRLIKQESESKKNSEKTVNWRGTGIKVGSNINKSPLLLFKQTNRNAKCRIRNKC